MKARIHERDLARRLRSQGYSHAEIRAIVPVGKGTLTGWLKDIELTHDQKQRILAKEADARGRAQLTGAWRNREKSLERIRKAIMTARTELSQRISDPLFLTGVVLYWAEGAKTTRCFHFMNSDPGAIRTMVKWLRDCAGVPKEKIVVSVQVHRVYADKGFDRFWVKVTGLPRAQFRSPVFKPTPHEVKKNPSYMGCCRLSVYSSELFWKLRGWQYALLEHLNVHAHSFLAVGPLGPRASSGSLEAFCKIQPGTTRSAL